jgi:hypothetical protein
MKQGLFILLLLCSLAANGQARLPKDARVELSRKKIKIGEQVDMTVRVHYYEGMKKTSVSWPEFSDTLTDGLEIVSMDSITTKLIDRSSEYYLQSRKMVITSIDSGTYIIPPLQFTIGNDTLYSDTVSLYVNTVPVDTTKAIKDIKPLYEVPGPPPSASKSLVSGWVWLLLGVIAAGVIALIVLLNRRKPAPVIVPPATILSPHEQFLAELNRLGQEQTWVRDLKLYHVTLADIMRSWLVERYHFSAREMTTREIIRKLKQQQANAGAVAELERVLQTADLVKFAKAFPGKEENELNLQLSIRFVQATALLPEPPATTEPTQP